MNEITLQNIKDLLREEIKPLNKRLDGLDSKLNNLDSKFTKKFEGLNSKFDALDLKADKTAALVSTLDVKMTNLDAKADKTSIILANLVEDFRGIPETIEQIRETQRVHGMVLDGIAKGIKDSGEKRILDGKLELVAD